MPTLRVNSGTDLSAIATNLPDRGCELRAARGKSNMSRKPVAEHKSSKPAQVKDQSRQPAKHIEEIARLASSVEPEKNPNLRRKIVPEAKLPA